MHRAAPFTAATRAYSAGGARSLVDKIDDKKMMQEMGGDLMKGEKSDKIESPQNYGFTSVVMPADKDKNGKITESAEAFMSFAGGSRSHMVATVMDDRRYRLKELEPGDTAFYDHQQQQFHFNKDGGFLTGRDDKKLRFQLVEKPEEENQQQGGGTPTLRESGASADSSSGQQQKKKGQKARYKKESKKFIDINKDTIDVTHDKEVKIKSPKHTFEGDVTIKGELKVTKNLRVGMEGYKPSNGDWLAGGVDGFGNVVMTVEQRAYLERKRAIAERIKIADDGSITIDGDFTAHNLTVTGNLTVKGVVRAKDFVKT